MKIPIFLVFLLIGIEAELNLTPDDYEIDPKDAFFRQFRSYDFEQDDQELIDPIDFQNIPKPGGFQSDDENDRPKRSYHVLPSPGLTSHFKINTDGKSKYKRTKRHAIRKEDPIEEISTSSEIEEIITTTPKGIQERPDNNSTKKDVVINDFIRFKRNPDIPDISQNPESVDPKGDSSRLKREPEIRTEKMVMDRDFNEPGTDREPRGATKEQWIKQPYPVERPVDDNVPSASDNIRAPRVHFVTQRRPGQNNAPGAVPDQRQAPTQPPPPPPPFHRMHDEREGRTRDFDRYAPPQPYYPAYPRPRSYDPYRPRYYDPYYERFDDRRYPFEGGYDQRYKYDDRDRDGRPMMPQLPMPPPPPPPPPPGNKQRRIIYYATLPEVVRNPNQNNDRYRYRYDGYDDRLPAIAPGAMPVGPPPAAGAPADRYGRKPYSNQLQKQREYDRATADRKKTPLYPVKVATDVNVREPKKNPERRIYSDVERRYNNYKPPSFQTAEDGNF